MVIIQCSVLYRFDTDVDLLEMMRSQGLVDLLRELPGVYEPETQMPIPPDIDYCPYPSRMSCRGKALTFRMADGACNNLNKPLWGRSLTPFRRLVAHRYDDGKSVQETCNVPISMRIVGLQSAVWFDKDDSIDILPFNVLSSIVCHMHYL